MTPRAAIRAARPTALRTLRRATLALLLAATLLAGGMLAAPAPPASATTLAVSAIAIQSSAGPDTQYHAGEDIVIRVTFGTETITAHIPTPPSPLMSAAKTAPPLPPMWLRAAPTPMWILPTR